jgi:hypothetical protein
MPEHCSGIFHIRNQAMANKYTTNDIKFIDPETFEVVCTYNGCSEKFELVRKEIKELHKPNKKQEREIVYFQQHRKCTECGKTVKLKIDERATLSSKANAIKEELEKDKNKSKK